jgi:hypothetical protein
MLPYAVPAIAHCAILLYIRHPLDHLKLALVIGILNLLGWYARTVEIVLVRLHRLRLLLRVYELHVNGLGRTRSLQLLVLLVLGVRPLPWQAEVDVLVSRGALRVAH